MHRINVCRSWDWVYHTIIPFSNENHEVINITIGILICQ